MNARLISKKELPFQHLSEKVARRYVSGEKLTIANFQLKKGALIADHHHPNEQITYVIHGSIKMRIKEKDYILQSGDMIIIPSNLSHSVEALEDSLAIDAFNPPREDWPKGDDAYLTRTSNR